MSDFNTAGLGLGRAGQAPAETPRGNTIHFCIAGIEQMTGRVNNLTRRLDNFIDTIMGPSPSSTAGSKENDPRVPPTNTLQSAIAGLDQALERHSAILDRVF